MSVYDLKTFIHDLVVLTVFLLTAFSFVLRPLKFPRNLLHFLENKSKNVILFSVVMSTLLYHPAFAVIPLLRGNSDANNQSNLRNFSAYIINRSIQGCA